MRYATGRYMCHHKLRHSFEVEDVAGIVRMTFADRVVFHDGDQELAPGIKLHACGGHSMGLQCVTVETARGTVVLASDVNPFLREPGGQAPLHHRLPCRRHAGRLLQAEAAGADPAAYRPRPRPAGDAALPGGARAGRHCRAARRGTLRMRRRGLLLGALAAPTIGPCPGPRLEDRRALPAGRRRRHHSAAAGGADGAAARPARGDREPASAPAATSPPRR